MTDWRPIVTYRPFCACSLDVKLKGRVGRAALALKDPCSREDELPMADGRDGLVAR